MKKITFSNKQCQVLELLEHPKYAEVLEVFAGGAAGFGKSFIGCMWQIERRRKYPGTRGMIGRSVLKNLKLTTLKTFEDCWNDFYEGTFPGFSMKLNGANNVIYFSNGSEIVLKDLFLYPSDKDFASLGSLEITDAFFDEVTEITEKAYTIAISRIRYKLINGVPKSYSAGNPANNWVKHRFVTDEDGNPAKLEKWQRFVPATIDDNPDPVFREIYRKNLEKLPYLDRQRLLYGDWNVIDGENLFMYEFNYNAHTVDDIAIDHKYELYLAYDFNNNPCTCLEFQVKHGIGIFFIREYAVDGGTRKLLEHQQATKDSGIPLRITGDSTGTARKSSAERTDFQIIEGFFRQRVDGRTPKANSSHIHSKAICNHALFHIPIFFSKKGCPKLINFMMSVKQTDDGKMLKKPIDPHLMDCFRYGINLLFKSVKDVEKFAALCTPRN